MCSSPAGTEDARLFPFKTVQNIRRLNQIVTVLVKYGFGELLVHLNLPSTLSVLQRLRRKPPPPTPTTAVRVKLSW